MQITNAMEKTEEIQTQTLTTEEQRYVDQLSELEMMAYNIAKNHLKSSFHLTRSNGFVEWKKKQVALEKGEKK